MDWFCECLILCIASFVKEVNEVDESKKKEGEKDEEVGNDDRREGDCRNEDDREGEDEGKENYDDDGYYDGGESYYRKLQN